MRRDMAAHLRIPKVGVAVAAVALVLDQITKYVMVHLVMRPPGVTATPFQSDKVIELLPVFNFRMTWNTGISFSLFNSGETLTVTALIAVQIGLTLLLAWYMSRMDTPWMQWATGLIVGGALGNIVDRAMYGAVADFLDFHVGEWHFPTFNVADSCISIGVFLWLLDAIGVTSHHARAESQKD
jgi:signal peptidase II